MDNLYVFPRTEFICRRLGVERAVMTPLEQIPPAEVGERLRIAREALKITQAAAAMAIGVARTTIVAIEQGERRARMTELQQLAKLYRTSVNALFRHESVHVDLAPRFRKIIGDN